ncbi:winged helix-turn-helix domain-containing protein [Aeromonas jandaei]|uniref:winged helix-turn-helix domain-containing protein n=1 Tax=Aeromonas jandaei TaxID=650 RepID=UPI003BA06EE4
MADNIFFELCSTHIFSPSHNAICTSDGILFHLRFRESKLLLLLLQGTHDKNKLIDEIWSGGEASENSYHKLVSALRSVLFDAGMGNSIIKTLPRRGCCFMGSVRIIPTSEETHWRNHLNLNIQPNISENSLTILSQEIDSTKDFLIIKESANKKFILEKTCQTIKSKSFLAAIERINTSKIYQWLIFSIQDNFYEFILVIALVAPFLLQYTQLSFADFSIIEDGEQTIITRNCQPNQFKMHFDESTWKVIYVANNSSYETYLLCKSKYIRETLCISSILDWQSYH